MLRRFYVSRDVTDKARFAHPKVACYPQSFDLGVVVTWVMAFTPEITTFIVPSRLDIVPVAITTSEARTSEWVGRTGAPQVPSTIRGVLKSRGHVDSTRDALLGNPVCIAATFSVA